VDLIGAGGVCSVSGSGGGLRRLIGRTPCWVLPGGRAVRQILGFWALWRGCRGLDGPRVFHVKRPARSGSLYVDSPSLAWRAKATVAPPRNRASIPSSPRVAFRAPSCATIGSTSGEPGLDQRRMNRACWTARVREVPCQASNPRGWFRAEGRRSHVGWKPLVLTGLHGRP
jgi:hypothetical protein